MKHIKNLTNYSAFSLDKTKKKKILSKILSNLTKHHYKNCNEYKKIINFLNFDMNNFNLSKMPFIPVSMFKKHNLLSVQKKSVVKTLVSSGTSGNSSSKIYLDKYNSINQTKILSKIFSEITKSSERLPMLIIDTSSVLKNRNSFSARGAAILGFSRFGKDITYVLNDDLSLNFEILLNFLNKYKNKKIIIFGFTYLLWNHFYKPIMSKDTIPNLKDSIIIHGGGWKKLSEESISNRKLKNSFKKNMLVKNIINYYGMVEQTGSIFFECENGYLHTSIFSDIIIRKDNLSESKENEDGIVELFSVLPTSYPGHIILTEDKGRIIGEDNCPCGKLGKYFLIHGRLKNSEVRGCSDTI